MGKKSKQAVEESPVEESPAEEEDVPSELASDDSADEGKLGYSGGENDESGEDMDDDDMLAGSDSDG